MNEKKREQRCSEATNASCRPPLSPLHAAVHVLYCRVAACSFCCCGRKKCVNEGKLGTAVAGGELELELDEDEAAESDCDPVSMCTT